MDPKSLMYVCKSYLIGGLCCGFLMMFVSITACAEAEINPRAPENDREVLVAFYHATNGPEWTFDMNWLSDLPIDMWWGVTTNADGRITHLALDGNNLSGELPAETGSLTYLKVLWLNENQLTGSIPPELGNLSNLEILDLRRNRLAGQMPVQLGDLANLRILSLGGNRLIGNSVVPLSSDDRAMLEAFYIATGGPNWSNKSNWMSDEALPLWDGVGVNSEGRVTMLDLRDNNLVGEIPNSLGNVTELKRLFLHINGLSGTIPGELGNLVELEVLDLGDNRLSGVIPQELSNLTSLRSLYLANWTGAGRNSFTGCLPPSTRSVDYNDLAELGLPFCTK